MSDLLEFQLPRKEGVLNIKQCNGACILHLLWDIFVKNYLFFPFSFSQQAKIIIIKNV